MQNVIRKIYRVLTSYIEINCSSKQQLADTDHTVRSKCLELIGALGRPDSERRDRKMKNCRKTFWMSIPEILIRGFERQHSRRWLV